MTFKVLVAKCSYLMWGRIDSLIKLVPAPESRMALTLYGEFLASPFKEAITNPLR